MNKKPQLNLEGSSREEARKKAISLSRKQEYVVDYLEDGRKVFIRTDGRKTSIVDGVHQEEKWDFTVHYDGESSNLNYVDDLLVDLLLKKQIVGEEKIIILIEAIKEAIEFEPISTIFEENEELRDMQKQNLPGHKIDFLLRVIRWLALQEDVNYWGKRPNGRPYEGREKPYNALVDLFMKEQSLFNVIKKHMLVPSFMR